MEKQQKEVFDSIIVTRRKSLENAKSPNTFDSGKQGLAAPSEDTKAPSSAVDASGSAANKSVVICEPILSTEIAMPTEDRRLSSASKGMRSTPSAKDNRRTSHFFAPLSEQYSPSHILRYSPHFHRDPILKEAPIEEEFIYCGSTIVLRTYLGEDGDMNAGTLLRICFGLAYLVSPLDILSELQYGYVMGLLDDVIVIGIIVVVCILAPRPWNTRKRSCF